MSYTYSTYLTALRDLGVAQENGSESNFELIVPRAIEYAELRMCREFDFLATYGTQAGVLTINSRNLTVPDGIIVIDDVYVITPSTSASADAGTRNLLERVSVAWLNAVYGTAAQTSGSPSIPSKVALLNTTTALVAPAPSAAYPVEFVCTTRPAPLSPNTTTTYISTYMPDMFLALSMVFIAGQRQNYGAMSDDPKMAMSWEQVYQTSKASADVEELRRKRKAHS